MAKYQAEFSCGHNEQVVLFGKSLERDRKLEWYKECGLCSACYAAQKEKERQEKTRIAEQHAQESGLRPLIGTEKQIAWAETIRQDRMTKVFTLLKAVADRMPQLWPACEECIVWLRDQVSAKWWIDNRNEDLTGLLIESEQFRQLVMDMPPEESRRYQQRLEQWHETQAKADRQNAVIRDQNETRDKLERLLGRSLSVKVDLWSGEKRCYLGEFGSSIVWYHTGGKYDKAETLHVPKSFEMDDTVRAEIEELCRSLCKKYNRFQVR